MNKTLPFVLRRLLSALFKNSHYNTTRFICATHIHSQKGLSLVLCGFCIDSEVPGLDSIVHFET